MEKALSTEAAPKDKLENLLLIFFQKWTDYNNDFLKFIDKLETVNIESLGFKNRFEFLFYVDTLVDEGYLSAEKSEKIEIHSYVLQKNYFIYEKLRVSYKGMQQCIELTESGRNSNKCFVAMSFKPEMGEIYATGIKPACTGNGMIPIRVDHEQINSEQTINDFMIASIKASKFCIADLTFNSKNVYFEMGYALGRGMKVIYCCRDDHFEQLEFDVRPLQIIKYHDTGDLLRSLDLKIKAYILD